MAGRKRRKGRKKHPEFGFFGDLLDATPVATLDLHGDTGEQAARRVRDFLRTQARVSPGQVVHIITGRGLGSRGRPVLPGVVRKTLRSPEMKKLVRESDRDLDDAGFLVRLR
jgi:DNA-nicking Smr family endonuclease